MIFIAGVGAVADAGGKHLILLTSLGRTGTLFIGENASRMIRDCVSYHEADVLVPTEAANWGRKMRAQGFLRLSVGKFLPRHSLATLGVWRVAGRIGDAEAIAVIRSLREGFFAAQEAGVVLEANTQYADLADLLPRAFPGANVIFVVRDPRDWARSMLHHPAGIFGRHDLRGWIPRMRLRPHDTGEADLARRWRRMPRFEKVAWSWAARHRAILPRIAGDPRVRLLRYEDILGSAGREERFREMLEFATRFPDGSSARIDFDPALLARRSHASPADGFPGWRRWDPALARTLERHCGGLMRRLGYGGEPEWAAKIAAGAP